jgi:hypothetical protein
MAKEENLSLSADTFLALTCFFKKLSPMTEISAPYVAVQHGTWWVSR